MIHLCAPSRKKLCQLVLLLAFVVTGSQAQPRSGYVEGEVIITFKSSASQSTVQSALQKKSLQFARRYGKISAIRKQQMGLVKKDGKKTAELIQELQTDPAVESVEPNYLRWLNAVPNDTRFAEQWALRNTGQRLNNITGTSGADIKYLEAWQKARPSTAQIVVGVMDTGLDRTHADLVQRLWNNPLEIPGNNIDDDGNGYVDDCHGYDFVDDLSDVFDSGDHGTHVAGIIGAQGNNSQGVIGVNDQVKLMPLKVSDNGSTISSAAVIEALEYAVDLKQRGIPLVAINASFGGGDASNLERDAITAAGSAGIILCVAAGNEGDDNNNINTYPASYRLPNMIVVAWSNSDDSLNSDSNYGSTTVDLAAPGDNILSTRPALTTIKLGTNTYSTSFLLHGGITSGLSGKIYDCGIGNTGQFPAGVSGNIALIQRGDLTFAEKVANAQAAGASAAIIYNNVSGLFSGTLVTSDEWIPVRTLSQADGLALKAMALPVTGSIAVESRYQYLDGTSMAAPCVTGAVAFAALNFPNESVTQRVQRILAAVDVKTGLQGKVRTGGRLNLNKVVDANQDGVGDWEATALIITNASALKGGIAGTPYSENFATSSGTAPLTFTVSEGVLPAGLTLSSTGLLAGTPTQAGTSTFTVAVTDSGQNSGSKNFTLVIASEAPQITSASPLPGGSTGAPYSTVLSATGGTAPYTWSISAGSLPAGLSLSNSGSLSGVPAVAAIDTFTLKIVDAHQLTAEKEVSLTVIQSLITITNPSALPYGMRAENYSQTLVAEGGAAPYVWSLASGSALPRGLSLNSTGILSGKPTLAGDYEFRIQVQDNAEVVTSKVFSLAIESVYVLPVVNDLNLDSTFVGASYSATFSATNYPKSFTIKGLPKGLTYSSKTGVISGRPAVSGEFTVLGTATNPAGRSQEVSGTLSVRALDPEWAGSFTGVIARSVANRNLGSRLTLTATSFGSFTVKTTTGATTKSATGYLSEANPQINVVVDGQPLQLTLDGETQLITGTHGTAAVEGWRMPWHAKTKPSNDHLGYYSAALNLADQADEGQAAIPQGSGYLTVRINNAGTVSIAGKTATGDAITNSSGMGPDGQALLYQSLYKHKGSLTGTLLVNLGPNKPGDNDLTGSLSWLKPQDTSRTYAAGFGPLGLNLSGGYLAPKSAGTIVRGLPETGSATLVFTDGGLALSDTDPDVGSFDFSSAYKVTLPIAGLAENPGRATLTINKATGAVTGTFTLAEDESTTKRKVSFLGMIVPQPTGETKAQGYFLLPQIPLEGQKSTTSPILSGGMKISQPEVQN